MYRRDSLRVLKTWREGKLMSHDGRNRRRKAHQLNRIKCTMMIFVQNKTHIDLAQEQLFTCSPGRWPAMSRASSGSAQDDFLRTRPEPRTDRQAAPHDLNPTQPAPWRRDRLSSPRLAPCSTPTTGPSPPSSSSAATTPAAPRWPPAGRRPSAVTPCRSSPAAHPPPRW